MSTAVSDYFFSNSCIATDTFSAMIHEMEANPFHGKVYEEVDGDAIITTQFYKWIWSAYRGNVKVNCQLINEGNTYKLSSWICSKQLGFTHKTRIYLQPQTVEWTVKITNL